MLCAFLSFFHCIERINSVCVCVFFIIIIFIHLSKLSFLVLWQWYCLVKMRVK